MTRRITLAVEVFEGSGHPTGYYAQLADVEEPCAQSYRSADDARKRLAGEVVERLRGLAEAERNSRRTLIACGDGTVLLVEFQFGAWGYRMAGAGRGYASSYCGAHASHDEVAGFAREHARQSFGGVTWECIL